MVIEQHLVVEPRVEGAAPMKAEEPRTWHRLCWPSRDVAERYLLEMVAASEPLDFDAREEIDFRIGLDTLDQVARPCSG